MGLVQTETWEQHDAGGFWFYPAWGTRDDDGPMPENRNWPYQLNQYELPFPGGDTSKRLAWGMNYGVVGQSAHNRHGDDGTARGWPFQSDSVAVVLGTHSSAPVADQTSDIESLVDARITTSVGRVLARGAGWRRPRRRGRAGRAGVRLALRGEGCRGRRQPTRRYLRPVDASALADLRCARLDRRRADPRAG